MAISLTKPDPGETGWGAAVNQNFEDIEKEFNDRSHIYLYRTTTFDIPEANTWTDLLWDDVAAPVKVNVTHDHTSDPEQITLAKAGKYLITWEISLGYWGSSLYYKVTRLLKNGTEIPGSYRFGVTCYSNAVTGSMLVAIAANDVIELQVASNSSGIDVIVTEGTVDPSTYVPASMSILRIGP